MLVGGHLAADDPIMVVAAAEDDLLVAGVADALPNGGRLAEIEHRARDRTIFAGRNRARIGRQIAFRGNGHELFHRAVPRAFAPLAPTYIVVHVSYCRPFGGFVTFYL